MATSIQVKVADVIIPEFRQRNKAEPDEQLCASIESLGLLQPIVLHKNNVLVAGERRLRAHMKLGRDSIDAVIFENLTPVQRFEAELQENLARKALTWQEEARAIGSYHHMRTEIFAGWTQMGTGQALGLSTSRISEILIVAEELDDPDVAACPTMKGAFNLISARANRAKVAAASRGLIAVDAVKSLLPHNLPEGASKEERTKALLHGLKNDDFAAETVDDIDASIQAIREGREAKALLTAQQNAEIVSDLVITADFLDWASEYEGPKFDVLHIDFPYGKGYSGARTRRTGKTHIAPIYADDPDIYLGLVEGFLGMQDRFTFPAAHCLFWFDMSYYAWTVDQFQKAGWTLIQPHPFIWSKGYQGIASDPKRRPRHVYETALMFSRGDRKIVRIDKDVLDCPIDEKLHLNQKPIQMLKHFLSMFVDEHTAVLDPTCGSGSALAAAQMIGAPRVLGIELDPNNADVAKFMLQRVLAQEPSDADTTR